VSTLSVVAPALRFGGGEVLAFVGEDGAASVVRHYLLVHAALDAKLPSGEPLYEVESGFSQGFLLSDGTFAARQRAAVVAREAGQANVWRLTSEDLWDDDGRPLWT